MPPSAWTTEVGSGVTSGACAERGGRLGHHSPELLVVSDEQKLLGRITERREHVRLEHLSGFLHHDDATAQPTDERLILRGAGGRHPHHGSRPEHLERLAVVELPQRRRRAARLLQSFMQLR